MRILANANFFPEPKVALGKNSLYSRAGFDIGSTLYNAAYLNPPKPARLWTNIVGRYCSTNANACQKSNPIQDSIINSTQMLQLFLSFKFIQYFSLC